MLSITGDTWQEIILRRSDWQLLLPRRQRKCIRNKNIEKLAGALSSDFVIMACKVINISIMVTMDRPDRSDIESGFLTGSHFVMDWGLARVMSTSTVEIACKLHLFRTNFPVDHKSILIFENCTILKSGTQPETRDHLRKSVTYDPHYYSMVWAITWSLTISFERIRPDWTVAFRPLSKNRWRPDWQEINWRLYATWRWRRMLESSINYR